MLLPGELRVGRSLRRNLERERYVVRFDTRFDEVIRACASTPRPGQSGTWITDEMVEAYVRLHGLGFAHSAEAFDDGVLVGGCYGVSLGRAFFGESMFAHRSDASKVAFVRLVGQLTAWGFDMIDCQLRTEHLVRFGAEEIPRVDYLDRLEESLEKPTRRGPWCWD